MLVGVIEQNGEHHCVCESLIFPYRGHNSLVGQTVLTLQTILSHGLAITTLVALSPFAADVDVQHRRMRWSETHPKQQNKNISLAHTEDYYGDVFVMLIRFPPGPRHQP